MALMRTIRKQSRSPVADGAQPAAAAWHRPTSTPKAGLPARKEKRRAGTAISFLVHLLLVLLIISPAALNTNPNLKEEKLGAGGAGPKGGGGGGNAGSGSIKYVKLAPAPTPPVEKPPVVKPPEIVPPKLAEPVIPALDLPKPEEAKIEVRPTAPIIGLGGGIGHDGTNGNGPGTGGGIGTGKGTGTGSGNGPGTGGGGQDIYPPTPLEMFIPPLPTPNSVKGFKLIADFDVDERGRIIGQPVFTPTKDGGYNRKLQDYLKTFKFRPGTTKQGLPIRAKYQLVVEF
jgi:protein TonB